MKRTRLRICCSLMITACLSLTARQQPDMPKPALTSKPIDWLNVADFHTLPTMTDGYLLADGNLQTSPKWTGGTEAPSTLFFDFPKPLTIEAFRFALGYSSMTHARLYGDLEGKGQYKTLLAEYKVEKSPRDKLITLMVKQKGVHGLKFQAISGDAGYRTPFPAYREIQIYSPDILAVTQPPKPHGQPMVAGKKLPLPHFTKRDVDIRLCTDLWMYGIQSSNFEDKDNPKRVPPVKSFDNHRGIKSLVNYLREVDANSVRYFSETACCHEAIPWPDPLWEGYGDDLLKGLTAELKRYGVKLYYFSHAWMSPFQKRFKRAPNPYHRWDYPYEASDRHVNMKEYKETYPCPLSETHFRDTWAHYLLGALANGASGVYLMPDEWYFKGHDLRYAKCPYCTEAFKKMFGYDKMPEAIENTEAYRKWKLFEYHKIAENFDYVAKLIRKKYPKAQIIRSDYAIGTATRGRMEATAAHDQYWKHPELADFAQMYGGGGKGEIPFVKEFEGTIGKDKLCASMQWLGISYGHKPDYSIQLIGPALADVIMGAKVIEHYRMNYIQDKGWTPNLKLCNQMIRLLEAWDVDHSTIPASVCMLVSRASEDWWSLKEKTLVSKTNQGAAFYLHLAGTDINKQQQVISQQPEDRYHMQNDPRGQGAKNALASLLVDNGVQYSVRYAEFPQRLKDLHTFKLILVPFAYALDQNVFDQLEKAARAGTKIIIFDQLAPVDSWGNPRPEPLLKPLLKHPNVTFIPEPLAGYASSVPKRRKYLELIQQAIATQGYAFNPAGYSVNYLVTKHNQKNAWILYLANWSSDRNATVSVSLPATPSQTYVGQSYSSIARKLSQVMISGNNALTTDHLKAFTVPLRPAEVKLIRIIPR